jgi:hypothetical protein
LIRKRNTDTRNWHGKIDARKIAKQEVYMQNITFKLSPIACAPLVVSASASGLPSLGEVGRLGATLCAVGVLLPAVPRESAVSCGGEHEHHAEYR